MRLFKNAVFLFFLSAGTIASFAYAHDAPESFSPIIAKSLPAIVQIQTFSTRAGDAAEQNMSNMLPPDSPLRKFFPKPEKKKSEKQKNPLGLGSGFIVDQRGYIVTNHHVIKNADEIEVVVNGKKPTSAKIIGVDKESDIAVLKIELGKEMPAIAFGDSDAVRVGDRAVVIGNPFGVGVSATTGIISARNRHAEDSPNMYFQTDAPMNPGNSGGPLVNLSGEVIGINTWIASTSGGSAGIGFSTVSNIVKHVVEEILSYGRVRRGWIGIDLEISPNTSPLVERAQDIRVKSVTPGSPAETAGLRTGDIFLSINNKNLSIFHDLVSITSFAPIGSTLKVEILRGESKLTFFMDIKERVTPQ